jgi:hypothetical protein
MKRHPFHILWRHWSSWFLWLLAALGTAWTVLPEFRAELPPWVASMLAIAGLLAKMVPQLPPTPKE